MRRLWAYIISAVTALVMVGVSFTGIFLNTNSNLDFQNGRELVFKIAATDDEGNEVDMEENENGAEVIAKEMVRRLEVAKVTRYVVKTQDVDTVKVTLAAENESFYENIKTYLSFNGNLALSNGHDAFVTSEEFLLDNKNAYITTYNSYPAIVVPIDVTNSLYQQMLEQTQADINNDQTEYGETTTSGENEDATETTKWYFYLWYDFIEGKCTFEATKDSSSIYQSRLLMKFEITKDSSFYFPDDKENKLYTMINLDANGDGTASVEEKENAYNQARFAVNLLNAGALDYKVTFLYQNSASAVAEQLIEGDGIALKGIFISTITAIAIISLLLVGFYRLGTLAVSTISIVSTFVGLASIVLFSAEFSVFGLTAAIAVAIASLASGIIYLAKLKDEAYRGRSLKKANSEAGKKSLLPILDINVALIIIGVFCYILGGTAMRTFAVISVFGGLASLLLNLLALRGLMWLATNATALQNKYEYFGINSEQVPDLIKEEKQSFYGAYADSDFTKKKKPVMIAFLVLVLASVVGSITFGALNNGFIYNRSSVVENSQIYFETSYENSDLRNENFINETILNNMYVYKNDVEKKVLLKDHVVSLELQSTWEEPNPNDETMTITHYTYIATLDAKYDSSYLGYYENSDAGVTLISNEPVNEVFEKALIALGKEDRNSISLKGTKVYTEYQPKAWPTALATLVGLAVTSVYLMLRYRLSRGLTTFLASVGVSSIALGLLSFVRFGAITNYPLAMVPVVALISIIAFIYIMNRERELIIDDKAKDDSAENRYEISKKAVSYNFANFLAFFVIAIWLGVDFFGFGPSVFSWMFIAYLIGAIVALVAIPVLYAPITSFFYKIFKGVNLDKFKIKKKKNKKVAPKSAEPEEAIFIGIND